MPNRKFELLVLLDPLRTEEQTQQTLAKAEETIVKNGGTVEKREDWGKKRLTFELKKRRDAYYSLITFDGPSEGVLIDEVTRFCRIDEAVLRFLVTRAVVGKSAGNPALYDARMEQLAAMRPPRRPAPGAAPDGMPVEASAEAAAE